MSRTHPLRARMLAGASALAIAIAISIGAAVVSVTLPAAAQGYEAEQVYRQEALAHARAIAESWRRLEDHILRRSAAATSWTGSVPPGATGWLDAWTTRGVRARYCEDTLLVYMEPAVLKGVGRDQRSVQVAPHLYAEGGLAALHWLEGGGASGVAVGTAGRASLSLPACLSDSSFGGPLPSGRAALAGVVREAEPLHGFAVAAVGTCAVRDLGFLLDPPVGEGGVFADEADELGASLQMAEGAVAGVGRDAEVEGVALHGVGEDGAGAFSGPLQRGRDVERV